MSQKNRKIFFIKIVILVLCFFVLIRIFQLVLAKYENEVSSLTEVDVAFFLLNDDFHQMTLNLGDLVPQSDCYTYTFSVGNQNEAGEVSETDMEYDLTIRTTTNLPLTYSLYENEEYDDSGAQSIITSNSIEKDDYDTYFRIMKTDTETLKYDEANTNIYQLVVNFPENYNTEDYQDIIEMIEITVNGKQKMS